MVLARRCLGSEEHPSCEDPWCEDPSCEDPCREDPPHHTPYAAVGGITGDRDVIRGGSQRGTPPTTINVIRGGRPRGLIRLRWCGHTVLGGLSVARGGASPACMGIFDVRMGKCRDMIVL